MAIPKPPKFKPNPSKTLSSNFLGFSAQSITSPILSFNHFFPLPTISPAFSPTLLTTALPPSNTLAAPALVASQASPNTLSPFFFFLVLGLCLPNGFVPNENLGNPFNIE